MPRRQMARARTGARPNRGWSTTAFQAYTVIPAASKVLLGSFTLTNPGIDIICLRAIGGVSVASDQAGADEAQVGAVGLIIVTDIALAAGIASIPGPFTDGADDGWFVHQHYSRRGSVPVTGEQTAQWFPIDSKGKRIQSGTGEVIAIVGENGSAAQGQQVLFQLRLLAQVRGTR